MAVKSQPAIGHAGHILLHVFCLFLTAHHSLVAAVDRSVQRVPSVQGRLCLLSQCMQTQTHTCSGETQTDTALVALAVAFFYHSES